MGFLKTLKIGGKSSAAAKAEETAEKSLSSKTEKKNKSNNNKKTKSNSNHKKKKHKSPRSTRSDTTTTSMSHSASSRHMMTLLEDRTPNEQAMDEYMECLNSHGSVQELLEFFVSPEAAITFEDSPSMTSMSLVQVMQCCYQGFGDLRFDYESIKEVRPGEILVEELVVTGTHTNDFSFAPGMLPAIPATNKRVILDPERMWFRVQDGKLASIDIISLGNLTGPPGLYLSVGGKLDMPPPPKAAAAAAAEN